MGIAIRAGVHVGEVEVRGGRLGGLAVHIGARVAARAETGEVLVWSTVQLVLAGSEFRFVHRGEHDLKGVPGTWRLFAVESRPKGLVAANPIAFAPRTASDRGGRNMSRCCPLRLGLVCAVVVSALVGCGGSTKTSNATSTTTTTTTTTTTAAAAGGGELITIHNLMFSPSPLQAKVGDTVTVTNTDGFDHTFTADDGSFDTGPFSSGSKAVKLAKAGTIAYHCNIHTFMHGKLEVSS